MGLEIVGFRGFLSRRAANGLDGGTEAVGIAAVSASSNAITTSLSKLLTRQEDSRQAWRQC